MACKWYAEFEGICCYGDCPECADICPYEDKQNECECYESEGIRVMTDNEIIKALECCNETKASECSECPLLSVECSKYDLYKLALDLINRQKADIERLTKTGKETVSCFTRMESLYKIKCKELEVAKAEAIKEFAERLKAYTMVGVDDTVLFNTIDNLAKEMVGETE